jgi:hypothetical protein
MINYKWGLIPALFALIVSVMLGAVSGTGFNYIIVRALVFAAVFFGLGIGMWFIVNSYFPELLTADSDTSQSAFENTGSRVNITVDNTGEYAVPELYKAAGAPDELGNIEDLISGSFKVSSESIDRNQEEGYNEDRVQSVQDRGNIDFGDMFQDQDTGGLRKSAEEKPVFTPSFVDNAGDLGGLPDLDAMAMAFSSMGEFSGGSSPIAYSGGSNGSSSGFGGGASSFSNAIEETDPASSRYNTGNKPQPLKGDFNPEEIAKGIRTILSKDK